MSQIERADYDDELFLPKRMRNPVTLRRAGTLWIITWSWFLLATWIVFGTILVANRFPKDMFGLLALHLFGIGLFLLGGFLIRKGKVLPLWFVSILSFLVGVVYGGIGLLVGLIMCVGIFRRPPSDTQVMGVILIILCIGFILFGLIATFFSLKYAIFKVPPIKWETPIGAPNHVAN